MKLFHVCFYFVTGLVLMGAAGGAVSGLPDTIEKIKPSVVGVGTVFVNAAKQKSKKPLTFRGTGFVVGNGNQVVTNYHVVEKPLQFSEKETFAVFTGEGQTAKVQMAKVVKMDREHDLALLEFSGPARPAMRLGSRQLREGEDVAFTGFPLGLVLGLQPVTHRAMISAFTPMVRPVGSSKQLTAAHIKRSRNPYRVYQLDGTAYPGNSGSPVFDIATGQVVAVINSVFVKETKEQMITNPSGISYAIPAKYVSALLK